MKIAVINGSPKGENSITLQTVLYLQGMNPKHEFEIIHVGKQIRKLEKDMTPALDIMKKADLILFAYPVYTFMAPSQLHRFITLVKASGIELSGKYASQITTSKHFYDVTAHNYIEENCADLGLKYIKGLSADMEDLLKPQGQKDAISYFKYLMWSMKKGYHEPEQSEQESSPLYKVSDAIPAIQNPVKPAKPVVIVADYTEEDGRLAAMIEAFRACIGIETRVVNIAEYPFKGGCISCFNCSTSGKCIYTDGFDTFLRDEIQTASGLIYAFSIKDHSMGDRFKMYDDRQFCNGHRTVTSGMPVGYLVDGHYSKEKNLQLVLEARAQVGGNYLCGVATDEGDPHKAIYKLADHMNYAIRHRLVLPKNFYGVGGMKIFRDLIYQMQGMMKADHKYFKSHGQYDFPQKKKGTIIGMYLVGAMMANKKLKAKMGSKMNEGMLMPYKKVIENMSKKL